MFTASEVSADLLLGRMGRAMIGAMGGAGDTARKSSWPEVVGWNFLAAGLKIKKDRPDIIRFEFHDVGNTVPPGHDDDRVRLFLTPGTNFIGITPFVG
jgi:hypothetical protein